MKKTILLLTMISLVLLTTSTPYLRNNHSSSFAIKKNNPKVTFSFPSEFTRYLYLQRTKIKRLSIPSNHSFYDVPFYWWDFNGSQIQQSNPYSYTLDSDNWPDCTYFTGNTYCEIKAHADTDDNSIPDLTSIDAIRYQPL